MIISLIIAVLVVIIDQVSKYLVVSNMDLHDSISVIPKILNFEYVLNDGMAGGIGGGFSWLFVVITLIVSGVMIYFMTNKEFKHPLYFVSAGLIIGGGIGNMIDRIVNGGKVVDFLLLSFFPFNCNLADYAITAGTVILAVFIIFFYGKKNKEKEPELESISDNNET